jgi:hypothetical protein
MSKGQIVAGYLAPHPHLLVAIKAVAYKPLSSTPDA